MKTLILAHNYQRPEVQDKAHYCGDSLRLCQLAKDIECKDIIFCGVDFMAETAAILNPDKRVFMPDVLAECPMAHQVTPEDIINKKKEYPDAAVVSYVNTTASVKAVSDSICTSSNAVEIVDKFDSPVIFTPDQNLGSYIKRFTDKEIIIVPEMGHCATHFQITAEDVLLAKNEHPHALVAVHPECCPEVIDKADYVGGTNGILNYVKTTDNEEFIIGTENGMLYRLQKETSKTVYPVTNNVVCPNMKITTIQKVEKVLKEKNEQNLVTVDPSNAEKAKSAIDKMFELME